MRAGRYISLFLILSAGFYGCDFFGRKTDLDFIEKPEFQQREIAYVPIQPPLQDFVEPVDICTGYDELLYVADQGAEEIVSMDESGRILGRFSVPGVKSVIQDRRLNLLAIGTIKDTISSVVYDLTCIYRINLQGESGYGIQYAEIVNTIVHPFYYKSTFSQTDATVEFNRIAVLEDNSYFVVRNGNGNSIVAGPDDAVLLFDSKDELASPVYVSSGGSLYRDYFKKPFAITTQVQPPQINASGPRDFWYSDIDPDAVIKVQNIQYVESEFGAQYEPYPYGVPDTSEADGYLTIPYRFENPMGMTFAGDASRLLFITDRAKDSVYIFSFNGFEGKRPPAGYPTSKYVNVSFGGTGGNLTQFNQPMGVAYKSRVLYVADSGNGRVLRFKLTTDFN